LSDPVTDEIMARILAQAEQVMGEMAEDAAQDMRDLISVPVSRTKGKVIRSAPGEPPRKDSGALQASVKATVDQHEKDKVVATVTTDVPYDVYLRDGTKKMAPRPFHGPIEAKWENILENRLKIAAKLIS